MPVDKGDGAYKVPRRYKRVGECARCGWCCIKEECEHLTWEGETAICTIHENRFDRCRTFPQAPPILNDKCGYHFLDTWEDDRVVRAREV